MYIISISTVLLATLPVLISILQPRAEDTKLNFTELGQKYEHSVEEFDVVTEDGYILTLFHIQGNTKRPILLMHGLFDCADTFMIRGKPSLAITLADKGYDVWVGNTRGNKYGRRHKYLNPDAGAEFWDFSFHEAGYYDLAATIDFVLKSTGEQSLRTIGHSQGTTAHFVLLSTKPEYNKKIKGFIALAPIVFLNNLVPPVSILVKASPVISQILESKGIEEMFRDQSATSKLVELICSQGIISYRFCYLFIIAPISGFDPKRIERDFWKVILNHFPAGSSRKGLMHYSQVALKKRFANYNYGRSGNFRRYKHFVPPSYDLRNITTNVALMVGQNDLLSRVKDVEVLKSMLPKEPIYHLMEPKLWSHADFIWANDMDVYLYPVLFSILQEFE